MDKVIWKNSTRKYVWYPEKILEDFNIKNNISNLRIEKGQLMIQSDGVDPFLVASNTLRVSKNLAKDWLKIFSIDLLFLLIMGLIFFTIELSELSITNKIKYFLSNYRAVTISICFVLIIITPMLMTTIGYSSIASDAEKRNLAKKPALNFSDDSYKTYISDVGNYVNDNFGFREQLIRVNNILKVKL
ncbi:hypothetical protein [Paenibacillus barengoltzii]|uniref:hypothetical protein n=1 Tax=Paenibacillus barengoltzii TaxID=343517 RepID=UPI000A164874|nr:hypothetical protein [Paenibacillus barengoltzii]